MRTREFAFSLVAMAIAGVTLLSGCGPKGNEPNVELMQDMMVSPAVKAQRLEPFFADSLGSRVPPENTQPVGHSFYRYAKSPDLAGKELKNPYAGKASDEVLLTGQKYYQTNCAVCHGVGGNGDGPIKPVYPLPIPTLKSDKIKNWSDGSIYHVITIGQGLMGPYASHIPQKYRWQVVSYIRSLQQQ